MKWIKHNQQYPQRWAHKKDIPAQWQYWAHRVEFAFETAWIVRDENRLVKMADGWADTFDFYLNTPGHVIGLADMATAQSYPWSHEWRDAMSNRRLQAA